MDGNHCEREKISTGFAIISISLIVSGFLGTVGNFALFCGLIRCKFLPVNVRFLLGNMTLGILLMIVFAGMDYYNKLVEISVGHLIQVSPFVCTFNSSVSTLTTAVVIISLGSLGIERWYSTSHVIPKLAISKPPLMTKENHTRAIRLLVAGIWIFSILTWMVMFAPYYLSLYTTNNVTSSYNETNTVRCSCYQTQTRKDTEKDEEKETSNQRNVSIGVVLLFFGIMFIYMTAEISSIILYFRVWRLNKTRLADFSINTARHSLQERFQIRQNIQITQMMLPAVILHAACWFSIQMMIVTLGVTNMHSEGNTVDRETSSMVRMIPQQIYQVLHPLLILWRSDNLRKAVKGVFLCKKQVYPTANDATMTYGDKTPNVEVDENPAGGDIDQPIVVVQGRSSQPPDICRNPGRLPPLSQSKNVKKKAGMEFKIDPDANAKILEQIWNTGKGAVL